MLNKLLLAAVLISLTLVSCREDGMLGSDGDNPGGEGFMLFSIEELGEVNIDAGDEINEFDIEYPVISENRNGKYTSPMQMRKKGNRHPKGNGLKELFKSFDLDDVQKSSLKSYMEQYRECAKPNFIELKELHISYRKEANKKRRDVIERVKSDEITKDQAKVEFKEIYESIKESLKADSDRTEIINAIKECREVLYEKVASILSPEQLEKLDNWLANKRK